jgi:hypothetical protein
MKYYLKLEHLGLFIFFSALLFKELDSNWLWFALLFFTPDVGILGYLFGPKIGSFTYNFTHGLVTAWICLLIAYFANSHTFYILGYLVVAHSTMDRFFGYGLKYQDSFNHTHLGHVKTFFNF